jgi:hypothetical protein
MQKHINLLRKQLFIQLFQTINGSLRRDPRKAPDNLLRLPILYTNYPDCMPSPMLPNFGDFSMVRDVGVGE